MLRECKDFLMKGNIVDLAVAFVIGLAFAAVITSWSTDLTFTINDAIFHYGAFITLVITFVAIAAAVFFIVVKPQQAVKARNTKEAEEAVPDKERRDRELLAALREQR